MPAKSRSTAKSAGKANERPVRIADVARKAGVSLMTVSRAFREPEAVADATRTRIARAAAELNYVGSAFAGQLKSGRTRLVAVVLPDLRNPVFALALQGLSDALGHAFELVVAASHGVPEGETRAVRALLSYHPAALVIHGGPHNRETRSLLEHTGVPVVEVGSLVSRPIDLVVGYSNRAAGRAATEHLLQRGHRTVAFVSQSRRFNSRSEERWRGFRQALAAARVKPRPELELESELGYERGVEAMRILLDREPKLDAVFFNSDGWALGALFFCQRAGIPVPQQVALMGFDDQEFSAVVVPALSTIHVPRYEMGLETGRLLRAAIAGEVVASRRIDLGFELKARQTT